jgi:hypothetical protein
VRNRLIVAAACGVVFWALAALKLRAAGPYAMAYDFTSHWRAGDALRRGYSPYVVINGFSKLYPFNAGYFWLLPTAVMLEPFAFLPMQTAMPIFVGVASAIFAYALTAVGWWRLPFMASAPFLYAATSGQIVPLVVAAMLVPSLGWLAPMKFTLAGAGFAYNLSLRYLALAAGVVIVSILLWPWWPVQWFHELHDTVPGTYYHVPVLLSGGFLLLGAVLRWRAPDARLLVVMACLPQTMFYYDQLPLLVISRTRRQALAMALGSWAAPLIAILLHPSSADRTVLFGWNAPIILACYYFPCLAIVLFRPNPAALTAPGLAKVSETQTHDGN